MSGLLWGNPLAWLGLAAVAVPVLVHLLAMRRARRVPFPTLRFLPDSSATSARRHRIEDLPLLLLRCLIVAVAVMALAQPWVSREGRGATAGNGIARALVVDSSGSMERESTAGGTALAAARVAADLFADEASTSTTIESPDIDAAIARAAVWLRMAADEGSATELVVISDFQAGATRGDALTRLPQATGVRLQRIEVVVRTVVDMPPLQVAQRRWDTVATLDEARTAARWSESSNPEAGRVASDIDWLAGADEQAGATAAMAAAADVVALPTAASMRPMTVVWPRAAERQALLASAQTVNEPWMAQVLATVPAAAGLSAARQGDRLLLFPEVPAGSLASASLLAALLDAGTTGVTPLGELEPGLIADSVLRGWERPSGESPTPPGSDARWLWLAVLGLLFVEQWVRHDL